MSPHFEAAAHLLRLLTGSGLTIPKDVDCRHAVFRIAAVLDDVAACRERVVHADAARFILGELECHGFAKCSKARRTKILAMIGTAVGNVDTMRMARSQK